MILSVSGFNQQDNSDAFVTCFSTGCWTWTDSVCISFVSSSGRKCYKLVAITFGLLCILQAGLNISLRLVVCEFRFILIPHSVNSSFCENGWIYFNGSFYYISSWEKSWQDSRKDCLQRGADLVIISNKEEQEFTRRFQKHIWIGLSDQEKEGTWKWVDGTPLTTSYWGTDEPNNYQQRNEDCGEIRFYNTENSWNDLECENNNMWICEKTEAL
uniref:C-type lectin domain-containing protein n=1 Tax=Monopterus albus TaxID=43700 RepID=A0A3Q3JWB0_MONAL